MDAPDPTNLPLERKVVAALRRHGLNHRGAPVIIQSFEQSNLRYLTAKVGHQAHTLDLPR